ncbi:hypothetical protein EBR96_08310, partial [bacterium]|nr:hypothetical protein [bacterium]
MPSLSRLTFYIAAGAMLGAVSLSAAPLTLDQYLNQVKQQNKSVVALNATIDSLSKKLSEKEL